MKELNFEYESIDQIPEKLGYWQKVKTDAETFSQRLVDIAPKYAQRIDDCCSSIKFQKYPNGYMRLKEAYFCQVRGCPVCEWRRSRKIASVVCRGYKNVVMDYPKTIPLLVELPGCLCNVSNIRENLTSLSGALTRFTNLKIWIANSSIWFRSFDFHGNGKTSIDKR